MQKNKRGPMICAQRTRAQVRAIEQPKTRSSLLCGFPCPTEPNVKKLELRRKGTRAAEMRVVQGEQRWRDEFGSRRVI